MLFEEKKTQKKNSVQWDFVSQEEELESIFPESVESPKGTRTVSGSLILNNINFGLIRTKGFQSRLSDLSLVSLSVPITRLKTYSAVPVVDHSGTYQLKTMLGTKAKKKFFF